MKSLIDLFWARYLELKRAVDRNDVARIAVLDCELDPLLEKITSKETNDADDIRAQFQFAIDLLNEEADDWGCVKRNSELLRLLVDRYVGLEILRTDARRSSIMGHADDAVVHNIIDEAKLDSLSDRVVVVSTGYRISYTNEANASRYDSTVADVVGCHIAEFVGLHRFQHGLREKLDSCFKGETVKYTYADDVDGRTIVMSFDMTPCYTSASKLIGAMIMVVETADRRRRSHVA